MDTSKDTRLRTRENVFWPAPLGRLGSVGRRKAGGSSGGRFARGQARQPAAFARAIAEMGIARYGMFIHFGMSTFVQQEIPDGKTPPSVYAPDRLDVDQWVSVARDAGMKYIVLTAKHVAGHCLGRANTPTTRWPTAPTRRTWLRNFASRVEKRGVLPGFYYCSWDNHNRFGSKTPSDGGPWDGMNSFPKSEAICRRSPRRSIRIFRRPRSPSC